MLAGVGALTGKKDLVKLGSVFALGSGLANMASSASSAASSAGGIGEAVDATGGLETAVETANAGNLAPGAYASINPGIDATGGMETAITPTGINPNAPAVVAPGGVDGAAPTGGGSLAEQAAKITGAPGSQTPLTQQYVTPPITPSAVQQGAQGLTTQDLSTWWEKAKAAGKAVNGFVKDNKELVNIVGQAYGPEAEWIDFKKDESAYNRSLMEQARRNLNSPVRLQYKP